jgi:hypothetical protein
MPAFVSEVARESLVTDDGLGGNDQKIQLSDFSSAEAK